MDYVMQHLWAAGYDLPPEISPEVAPVTPKRRGKKAAKAKRQKAEQCPPNKP
jgi:hypothetical protein